MLRPFIRLVDKGQENSQTYILFILVVVTVLFGLGESCSLKFGRAGQTKDLVIFSDLVALGKFSIVLQCTVFSLFFGVTGEEIDHTAILYPQLHLRMDQNKCRFLNFVALTLLSLQIR